MSVLGLLRSGRGGLGAGHGLNVMGSSRLEHMAAHGYLKTISARPALISRDDV